VDLGRNQFKHAIAKGKLQIGLWSSLASNIAADVIRDSGFDWVLLDSEHSPNELPGLLAQMQALSGSSTAAIIRPAWNDPVLIKRILDIGAQSILLPYVQNADEARKAVAATRYPPDGVRGIAGAARSSRYGRIADYLKKAADELCVLVQVETRQALGCLEEIARVDGVDGVFIGPSDLSGSMGHIGNPAHPEVQQALKNAVERLTACRKPSGILTLSEDDARRYIEWGYNFVAVGMDVALLARGADMLAKKFKASAQ
jgi:4-hydroxy-2-oxoheptanedioate aldolase